MKTLEEIFVESLSIELSQVTDELTYQSIKQWDSTAHMILIASIEDNFDILMDTDDIIDMSSVAKAKEIINKYLAEE